MHSAMTIRSRLWRQVFCLLLTVSLWRGPMPVLHDHADLAQGTAFSRHLLQYHDTAAAARAGVQTCQSHWHFAPLRDVLDPNAPPQKSGDDDISAFRPGSTSGRGTGVETGWPPVDQPLRDVPGTVQQSAGASALLLAGHAAPPCTPAGGRTILLKGMSFLL